jgi:hypothetical protein
MSRKITVELTEAQAYAVVIALDATAIAGDYQDAEAVYGNGQTIRAAVRALEAVQASIAAAGGRAS